MFYFLCKVVVSLSCLVGFVMFSGTGSNSLPLPQAWMSVGLEDGNFKVVPVPQNIDRNEHEKWLQSLPNVTSVELDAPVLAATVPNDPFYASVQFSYLEKLGLLKVFHTLTEIKKYKLYVK